MNADVPQPLIVDVLLPLRLAGKERARRKAVAEALSVEPARIVELRLLRESLDARHKPIQFRLRLEVGLDSPLPPLPPIHREYSHVPDHAPKAIIVGMGPAGMFAALRCLDRGILPVVLERGKDVDSRRADLDYLHKSGEVNPESNYCFGEGGAGTFSDGKLFTRATKRGPVQEIYQVFVSHGAPSALMTDAHPHLGSDLLPQIVKNIRQSILQAGGEVHFQSRVTDLLLSTNQRSVRGVVCADGRVFEADAVILATGHSARDIYRMLHGKKILLQKKAFAMGVRIEHPQYLIDRSQYHLRAGERRDPLLPAARYALSTKIADRGVHSFCMCPGGYIIPAATDDDEVVVNGMSLSHRDSPYANAGFVVTVEPQDSAELESEWGVLSGMMYQKNLEQQTARAGGGQRKAPAQLADDFMKGRISSRLLNSTYEPGIVSCPLHELLPAGIVWRMREGLELFNRQIRGFSGPEAQLVGCETRTSSPLRIPRESPSLQHPEIEGLYPCGEGAGYAGGIVSAAMDGLHTAEAVAAQLKSQA